MGGTCVGYGTTPRNCPTSELSPSGPCQMVPYSHRHSPSAWHRPSTHGSHGREQFSSGDGVLALMVSSSSGSGRPVQPSSQRISVRHGFP